MELELKALINLTKTALEGESGKRKRLWDSLKGTIPEMSPGDTEKASTGKSKFSLDEETDTEADTKMQQKRLRKQATAAVK